MKVILVRLGQLAGVLGLLLIIGSIVERFFGIAVPGDISSVNLMLAAICALGTGCFLLLTAVAGSGHG